MLLNKKIGIFLVGIALILSGCFNQYSKETADVENVAQKMSDDLFLLEKAIKKGGVSFEHLNDMSLTHNQIFKINQQYEKTPYGLFYNKNTLESSGVLTGYQPIDYLLKKRLYKTEVLEKILIEAYNNHALIDQAYYIEGNGLLRIYPSIRVTDNISPQTNFFDIRVFKELQGKDPKNITWFTVPFLNPSGRNWVISLFNPIYTNDELQGVLGYDIVASNFENYYLDKDMMLINREGDIISVDSSLFQLLNIKSREHDVYYEKLMAGKLPDKSYNLKNSKIKTIREMYSKIIEGKTNFNIQLDHKYFVISKRVEIIDSYLIKILK